MINTPADARAYVSFAKFPPIGERSWGPHRATTLANMPDQKVYLREANELTVTFAMIETQTALDNVEAIAATPGIDALFLGPADLSIALSKGANVDPMAGEVDRELDRIIAAANKAGKIMGAYCHSAERAVALAKRGMRFLAVGSDMAFLRAGAAAALKMAADERLMSLEAGARERSTFGACTAVCARSRGAPLTFTLLPLRSPARADRAPPADRPPPRCRHVEHAIAALPQPLARARCAPSRRARFRPRARDR